MTDKEKHPILNLLISIVVGFFVCGIPILGWILGPCMIIGGVIGIYEELTNDVGKEEC